MFYSDAEYDAVHKALSGVDAYICRINPGKYDGVTQKKVNELLADVASKGVVAMSHPEVMRRMGAKDALVKIRDLSCGMKDTYAYYTIEEFKKGFPETIKLGVRVLKQNRGSQGEGIWVVKVSWMCCPLLSHLSMVHRCIFCMFTGVVFVRCTIRLSSAVLCAVCSV
jgi:glutathione synthase/RimK-type ligase-like ATP-grasp enzyme